MGRFGTVVLAAFLLGPSAATPTGLAFDLPPPLAFLAVFAGVTSSFAVALFAMERLRAFWRARRPVRVPEVTSRRAERRGRTARRAHAVLDRFGPVGLGLVGPAVFGTWVSAAVGTAVGMARWRLFTWLVIGAGLWTGVLVVASDSVLRWLFG
ncbi:small multi-drug export protein [Actinophytocola oryzae]|uniref:Putative small multi-drug export protein n=1 Tax=Actinophytocola oryzae TaxID=502181 RepID=A0A4R7VVH7_9PSEU|nr:small multi-drug export protein [Actinophytocola oryzae]TDV53625.1 putative small multi-drug export protein [Actinophytocola oryzae]